VNLASSSWEAAMWERMWRAWGQDGVVNKVGSCMERDRERREGTMSGWIRLLLCD
jgi:hypothetical protein